MKKIIILALLFLPGMLFSTTTVDKKNKNSLRKTRVRTGQIEANNVKANISNIGSLFWDGGDSGYIIPHPAFSNNVNHRATIFASGMWLGGKIDGEARVSTAMYEFDYAPGTLETDLRGKAVFKNINSPEYRIHYKFSNKHRAFLENLLSIPDNTVGKKVHKYATDRLAAEAASNWEVAVSQGAPENPPGDENAFAVFHDADPISRTVKHDKNKPLFVEIRQLVWAYRISGALNNAVFIKWDIINRGKSTITDMYASVWADPDLGSYSDDFVGSDKEKGLGYCYNGEASDVHYTGDLNVAPPAVGYDYFQGVAVVDENSTIYKRTNQVTGFEVHINKDDIPVNEILPTDEEIKGFRINPTSSFVYFNNTSQDDGNPLNSKEVYNYMRARTRSGNQFPSQVKALGEGLVTQENKNFFFSGDPESNTGWLDEKPDDRRFLQNNGPFTMQPFEDIDGNGPDFGDPGFQTVIIGTFTSFGRTNLNSVTKLKAESEKIQKVFNNAMEATPSLPAPIVKTHRLDEAFAFSWENGVVEYQLKNIYTEEYNLDGYNFEGYQIVQYKDQSRTEFKQIAFFDLKNGIKSVNDNIAHPENGEVQKIPVLKASDSGLKRSLKISENLYADNSEKTFYNGVEYHFGIRAVSVLTKVDKNSKGEPIVLDNGSKKYVIQSELPPGEDSFVRFGEWANFSLTPSRGSIGAQDYAKFGELLPVKTEEENGELFAVVVDPKKLTGETYTASIDTNLSAADYTQWTWRLKRGDTLLDSNLTISTFSEAANGLSATADAVIYDGIRFTLKGIAGSGVDTKQSLVTGKKYSVDGEDIDNTWLHAMFKNSSSHNIFYFGGQGWAGTEVQASDIKDIELVTGPGITQMADFHERPGYAYIGRVAVPFIVREIKSGRQLQCAVVQHSAAAGLSNALWQPYSDGDGRRGYVWVYDVDYDQNVTVSGAQNSFEGIAGAAPVIAALAGLYADNIEDWGIRKGLLRMVVLKNVNYKSTFTVVAPKSSLTDDPALVKENMNKITIYPNPYTTHASEKTTNKFVTIQGLPNNYWIEIYNIQGQRIKTIDSSEGFDDMTRWNFTNNSNIKVASGLYFVVIKTDKNTSVVKKFVYRAGEQQLPIF
jgi:hypothetical protein